jgi:hypothetical protein
MCKRTLRASVGQREGFGGAVIRQKTAGENVATYQRMKSLKGKKVLAFNYRDRRQHEWRMCWERARNRDGHIVLIHGRGNACGRNHVHLPGGLKAKCLSNAWINAGTASSRVKQRSRLKPIRDGLLGRYQGGAPRLTDAKIRLENRSAVWIYFDCEVWHGSNRREMK